MRSPVPLLLGLLIAASPATAGERKAPVAVASARLDAAIVQLGRQTGASIGLSDRSLTTIRVRPVSGRLAAGEALAAMLEGTPARARKVAPDTWLIERRPSPPRAALRLPPVETASIAPEVAYLPEIIVTATKRDTPVARYAGAVTIADADDFPLSAAGRGTEALEARVASIASTHLGPGRNKLFIRGVSDSSFTGPTQATVGQYWGDTRITYSAPDPSLSLYDVRAVEVLEGPQGTLYGAGSLGGIIRVVPQSPRLSQFEARGWFGVEAVEHGAPGGDIGGLVNVPLAGGAAALRLVGYGRLDGGYIDDRGRGLDDVNRVETFGGRAMLRVEPGEGWVVDLSAVGQSIEGEDAQYADRLGNGLSRSSAVAQPFRNDYVLGSVTVRKRWDSLELVTSLGIVDQTVSERFDATLAAGPVSDRFYAALGPFPGAFAQDSRIRMITSDTRLSASNEDGSGWVIGASLLRNTARLSRTLGSDAAPMPVTGVRNQVDEGTLYGEATFLPREWLALTGGARLTYSRLSGSAEDAPQGFTFRFDPAASASRTETRLLPSVSAIVRPGRALSFFARYQEGFRPGGLSVDRDFIRQFKGDRIATAEAGMRAGGRPGDRLGVSLTLAHTRWNDIQADLVDGFGFPTTANIGDGRILSLGLAAKWRPVPELSIDAALYLNDSDVTAPSQLLRETFATAVTLPTLPIGNVVTLPLFDPDEAELPNVADASARLGASWLTRLFGQPARVEGYARYVGHSRLGIGPILGRRQGDYLDTGLELRVDTGIGGISLSATNLLDTRGNRFALGSPFLVGTGDFITPLRPRTFRIGFETGF